MPHILDADFSNSVLMDPLTVASLSLSLQNKNKTPWLLVLK
jgi:hypothetical protein